MRIPPKYFTGPGTANRYLSLGLSRSGIAASDASFSWQDFLFSTNGTAFYDWSNGATNGTLNMLVAGAKAGVARLSTSVIAASLYQSFSNSCIVGNTGTDKWYFAMRARFPTAIDAQSNLSAGLLGTSLSNWIQCGFIGPLNAANFGVQFDGNLGSGSFLNSGIAKDTAFHVFEIYSRGDSILRFRLDNGAEITGTQSAAFANVMLAMQVRNGTTAADRQMDMDWLMAITDRG